MAPSTKKRHISNFKGKQSLIQFIDLMCSITGNRRHTVKRCTLYDAYNKFCFARQLTMASVVNMGRYLGSMHVWASKRLGGSNGRHQMYAYVGLCLHENDEVTTKEEPLSPSPNLATTLPPVTAPTKTQDSPQLSTDSSSSAKALDLLLQHHVEFTGWAEDAVPVEELHAVCRQLYRANGIKRPSFTKIRSNLLARKDISISRVPFVAEKMAYTGLRWTPSNSKLLSHSKRAQPMSCSSCKAKSQTPTVIVTPYNETKQEDDSSSPLALVIDDGLGDHNAIRHFEDDDAGTVIDILHTPDVACPTFPETVSTLNQPYLKDTELIKMLDLINNTDFSLF